MAQLNHKLSCSVKKKKIKLTIYMDTSDQPMYISGLN